MDVLVGGRNALRADRREWWRQAHLKCDSAWKSILGSHCGEGKYNRRILFHFPWGEGLLFSMLFYLKPQLGRKLGPTIISVVTLKGKKSQPSVKHRKVFILSAY